MIPKEKSMTKTSQNNEIIHIAPIQIDSTPTVDTAKITLANLKQAISSSQHRKKISPEEEAKEVLSTLKETIKPITKTEKPKKKKSPIKKVSIKRATIKKKTVVKVKKKIHQTIQPKSSQKIVISKTKVQKSKAEEPMNMDNLPWVQPLGLVEKKEYIINPQKEIQNKEAYDGAGTTKFNKVKKGETDKKELENLKDVQTLGVIKIEEF